jgi:hypothetical protein
VPRAQLACGSVGNDGDETVVQSGRPALRIFSGPTTCMGHQLVRLHGVGYWSPTRRGGGVRSSRSRACRGPRPSRSRGELVQGRDLSEGVPLVGNWLEMLPTGREHDVLPVRVLTGVLSPPRLESWTSHC